jgi:hypothetical protein
VLRERSRTFAVSSKTQNQLTRAHVIHEPTALENWTTCRYPDAVGKHEETKRFRVRVSGPLSGDRSAECEFVMIVRRYGDCPGWWIRPGRPGSPRAAGSGPDAVLLAPHGWRHIALSRGTDTPGLMAVLKRDCHAEPMSLTTDGLALGSAVAVAVGSAVQARQAYNDLNEKTPAKVTLGPLLRAATGVLFNFAIRWLERLLPMGIVPDVGALFSALDWVAPTPTVLNLAEVATLTPGQDAKLTAGERQTLATGGTVTLTDAEVAEMDAARAKDIGKWLGWFLGWILILIGAIAAAVGAYLTLKQDL